MSGTVHIGFDAHIAWSSKKQDSIALIICKAEYVAAKLALKEALWLQRLLDNIDGSSKGRQVQLHADNQSAIDMASKKCKTKHRKHIDIRYHHLSHYVKKGSTMITHIDSKNNLADGLTKPLEETRNRYVNEQTGIGVVCQRPTALGHQGVWQITDYT